MTTIVAVSVSDQIEKFGAYAGFAAVIGLAVLSMLYFAQAREAKRLREWANSRAPEVPPVPAGQPQRAVPQPVTRAAGDSAAGAVTPGTPITPAAQAANPETVALPGSPAATPAAATASAAGAEQPTEVRPATSGPGVGLPGVTPGQLAEGAAGGQAASGQVPAASPASGEEGAQRTIVSPPPARALRSNQPSATPPRPPAPARPGVPGDRPGPRGANGNDGRSSRRSRMRTFLPVAVVACALLAVGLVATGVIGGGSDNEPKENVIANPMTGTDTTGSSGGPVDRSNTSVAVLNGTTIVGLARGIANNIEDGGFRVPTVENAPDQTRAATSVEYIAGAEAEAREVASLINLQADSLAPMAEGTRVLAPGAQVVVTVGADQSPTDQP